MSLFLKLWHALDHELTLRTMRSCFTPPPHPPPPTCLRSWLRVHVYIIRRSVEGSNFMNLEGSHICIRGRFRMAYYLHFTSGGNLQFWILTNLNDQIRWGNFNHGFLLDEKNPPYIGQSWVEPILPPMRMLDCACFNIQARIGSQTEQSFFISYLLGLFITMISVINKLEMMGSL